MCLLSHSASALCGLLSSPWAIKWCLCRVLLILSVMESAGGNFTPTTLVPKTPQSSFNAELSLWISRSSYVTANYQRSLFGNLFCNSTYHAPNWTYLSLLNQPLKYCVLSIVNDAITCLIFWKSETREQIRIQFTIQPCFIYFRNIFFKSPSISFYSHGHRSSSLGHSHRFLTGSGFLSFGFRLAHTNLFSNSSLSGLPKCKTEIVVLLLKSPQKLSPRH